MPAFTAAEQAAMRRAIELAQTDGVPLGPNPRVGCVLLDAHGRVVAEGFHRGAGTKHAEVDALTNAGDAAKGTTAVVTLEPCNHQGRTGPCVQALLEAGVTRVVYAQPDPNRIASGGAEALRKAGVIIESGLHEADARRLNRAWTFAIEHQRPFVTWKFATTLDGRSAAADGSSRWISNAAARRDTHRLRAECDVVLAGTGTVLTDDPQLTVRDELDQPLPRDRQPLRVVMGLRDVPEDRRALDDAAPTAVLHSREPAEVLEQLFALDRRHVFLEGGPTVAAAFLREGLVDEVVAYVAPMLLGAGTAAVAQLGIDTLTDAFHLHLDETTTLGDNVRLILRPRKKD